MSKYYLLVSYNKRYFEIMDYNIYNENQMEEKTKCLISSKITSNISRQKCINEALPYFDQASEMLKKGLKISDESDHYMSMVCEVFPGIYINKNQQWSSQSTGVYPITLQSTSYDGRGFLTKEQVLKEIDEISKPINGLNDINYAWKVLTTIKDRINPDSDDMEIYGEDC